jgi:hypothetical protein
MKAILLLLTVYLVSCTPQQAEEAITGGSSSDARAPMANSSIEYISGLEATLTADNAWMRHKRIVVIGGDLLSNHVVPSDNYLAYNGADAPYFWDIHTDSFYRFSDNIPSAHGEQVSPLTYLRSGTSSRYPGYPATVSETMSILPLISEDWTKELQKDIYSENHANILKRQINTDYNIMGRDVVIHMVITCFKSGEKGFNNLNLKNFLDSNRTKFGVSDHDGAGVVEITNICENATTWQEAINELQTTIDSFIVR